MPLCAPFCTWVVPPRIEWLVSVGGFLCMQVVCDFCEKHLEANKEAFADPRLHLIVDDARAQLEKAEGPFDVIIGDLADPVFGGPCYQVSCAAASNGPLSKSIFHETHTMSLVRSCLG